MKIGLRNNGRWLTAFLNQPVAALYKMTAVNMLRQTSLYQPAASLYQMTAVNMLYSSSSSFSTGSYIQPAPPIQIYHKTAAPYFKQFLSTAPPDKKKISPDADKKPILSLEEHRVIKESLDKKTSFDLLVHHILDKNILVSSLALENNLVWLSSQPMTKMRMSKLKSKSLLDKFKIGKFTSETDEIILNNWETLVASVNVQKEDAKKEIVKVPEDTDGIKNNVIGYYVSQGMNEDRLAAEVFQRLKKLLVSGEFSSKEDQILLSFVNKNGRKWTELSKLMGRRSSSLLHRFNNLENKEASVMVGDYNIKYDKIIITEVFRKDRNILETDGNVTEEVYVKIGSLLNRSARSVQQRWLTKLEPILRRHHAGTLDVDIREQLITYLVENNLNYPQDIDWDKLAKMPEYAGHTSRSLERTRNTLMTMALKKFNVNYTNITAADLKQYWDNSRRYKLRNKKQQEHLEALLDFYTSNILN